ncbi:MAG TPA: AAA family ATPase [Vicinamibacterales bacterium]|nr:AAA family ATPase [Vicinamibacterales bacterium]
MKIAVAGKGGSGKTTVAAALARALARRGHRPLAIDADSNPNLGVSLGLSPAELRRVEALPRTLLEERTDADGRRTLGLAEPADQIVARFAVPTPEGVRLLLMGAVDHAGAG